MLGIYLKTLFICMMIILLLRFDSPFTFSITARSLYTLSLHPQLYTLSCVNFKYTGIHCVNFKYTNIRKLYLLYIHQECVIREGGRTGNNGDGGEVGGVGGVRMHSLQVHEMSCIHMK